LPFFFVVVEVVVDDDEPDVLLEVFGIRFTRFRYSFVFGFVVVELPIEGEEAERMAAFDFPQGEVGGREAVVEVGVVVLLDFLPQTKVLLVVVWTLVFFNEERAVVDLLPLPPRLGNSSFLGVERVV